MATKKINKRNINSLLTTQNKKQKIYVQGDYELNIDEVFKESKIDIVISDYFQMFNQLGGAGEKVDTEFINGSSMLLMALIIREFSDIGVIPAGSNAREIYPIARNIYDIGKVSKDSLGMMGEIMQSFDVEQVERVFHKVNEMQKNLKSQLGKYALERTLQQVADEQNEPDEDLEIEEEKEVNADGEGQV